MVGMGRDLKKREGFLLSNFPISISIQREFFW